mgnify:CR=1 FL=1
MTPSPSAAAPAPLNRTAWLICIIASIGFAFDIYELLMLPLSRVSSRPSSRPWPQL